MTSPRLPISRQRAAFSLTELIVASGLVIVVSALLIGGVMKASDFARQTKCTANLKTYGSAVLSHAVDRNNTFLSPGFRKGVLADSWNYRLHNDGYLSFAEQRGLYCPALYQSETLFISLKESEWIRNGYLNSVGYAYNLWIAGKRMAAIPEPSKTMIFIEAHLGNVGVQGTSKSDSYAFRHSSRLHGLHCDGSISSLKKGTPLPPATDPFWAYPPAPQ